MKADPIINVPVILGPTASGKTECAVALAEHSGWDIISCDSRQIYRGMDIGTAKPSPSDQGRARHWLIDIIDPGETYSVVNFVHDACAIIRSQAAKGRRVMICGGTGLYFEGLRRGIGPQVATDPEIRDVLMNRIEKEGSDSLHRELFEKDRQAAMQVHVNDVQRIVRALAVCYQTGKKISELKQLAVPPADIRFSVVVLWPPRSVLYERINTRVDEMVRRGLWDEFVRLRKNGYTERSPGMQCLGYRELFGVDQGVHTFDRSIALIKQNSRRFAKRQMSWYRAHNSESLLPCENAAKELLGRVGSALGPGYLSEKEPSCH